GVEFRRVGITGAELEDDHYRVAMADGGQEQARFLLIATGIIDDLPGIVGFEECYGRSIFHCPYCDGWECRDRRLAAYGRGSAAAGLALALRTWSDDVVLCTNRVRPSHRVRERLARNQITLKTQSIARLDHRDGMLTAIQFESGQTLERDAIFL